MNRRPDRRTRARDLGPQRPPRLGLPQPGLPRASRRPSSSPPTGRSSATSPTCPSPASWVALDIGDDRALVIRGQDGDDPRRPQPLPPPRRPRRRRRRGPVPERPRLPVPRLGLQPRRHPARPGAAAAPSRATSTARQYGLKPMECEIWMGFVFVRCPPRPAGLGRRDPRPLRRRLRRLPPRRPRPHRPGLDLRDRRQLEVGPRRRQRGLPRRDGPPGASGPLRLQLPRLHLPRGPRLVDRPVQRPRRPPLERAPLPEDPARPAEAARGQAPLLGLLRHLPERGLHHDPRGRAVLPGAPARHRPHADPLDEPTAAPTRTAAPASPATSPSASTARPRTRTSSSRSGRTRRCGPRPSTASTSPTSNGGCAAITTACAACCRC